MRLPGIIWQLPNKAVFYEQLTIKRVLRLTQSCHQKLFVYQ
jgi:hypothetical protein